MAFTVKEVMFGGPESTQHSCSLAEALLCYICGSWVLTMAGAQEKKSHHQEARREGGACLASLPDAPPRPAPPRFYHSETKHLPANPWRLGHMTAFGEERKGKHRFHQSKLGLRSEEAKAAMSEPEAGQQGKEGS